MQKGYNEDPECQILSAFPLVLLTNKRLFKFLSPNFLCDKQLRCSFTFTSTDGS